MKQLKFFTKEFHNHFIINIRLFIIAIKADFQATKQNKALLFQKIDPHFSHSCCYKNSSD